MRVGGIAGGRPPHPRSGHAGLRASDRHRRRGGNDPLVSRRVRRQRRRRLGGRGRRGADTTIEFAAKWTGPEEENSAGPGRVPEETGATVNYASTGENTDAFLGPASGQQPAGRGDPAAAGPDAAVRRRARSSRCPTTSWPRWRRTRRTEGTQLRRQQDLRRHDQGRVQVDPVVPPAGVRRRQRQPPTAWEAGEPPARCRSRHHAVHPGPGRRLWTLTDWFENVTCRRPGRRTTTSWPSTRSSGRTRRSGRRWSPRPDLGQAGLPERRCRDRDRPSSTSRSPRSSAGRRAPWSTAALRGRQHRHDRRQVGTDIRCSPSPGGDTARRPRRRRRRRAEERGRPGLMKFLASRGGKVWAGPAAT